MKTLFVNNAWSDNKKYSTVINVLLFLVSINFLHYGQLLLPVICLFIFIINNKKLYLGDIKEFVCLLLFGIFFFIFDTTEGIYRTIGLFLPMAYYIGSNIHGRDLYKNILYLLAIGMAFHALLDFVYDYSVYGLLLFRKQNHFDFWTGQRTSVTSIATNFILFFSVFFYMIKGNLISKKISWTIFILLALYNLGIGRRTPVFIIAIALFIFIIYAFLEKQITINYQGIYKKLLLCCILLILLVIAYFFNLFNIKNAINKLTIVEKFSLGGFKLGRFYIYKIAFPYLNKFLWGGRKISSLIRDQFHDVWFDIFDAGGIVCFILFIIFTLIVLKKTYNILKNKNIELSNKFIVFSFIVCNGLQMCIEPIISSSSIYIISIIIIFATIEHEFDRIQ